FGTPLAGINRRAGYMFQTDSLMPWRTALQNVAAGLEFRGSADSREQAHEWLKRVGLGGFADRYPHQLSGGMRKRVSLAQTLVLDPDIILMFENDRQAAFFFGEPVKIFGRIWTWFVVSADIYQHLWVTLLETALAFAIGTALGLAFGLWLALSPMAGAIADPYIKALNSMPRVILAPIFAVWFGLGVASKVALGVTLVFFIVFFNVYQGVKEVSPVVLANARMLGASQRQLLRH